MRLFGIVAIIAVICLLTLPLLTPQAVQADNDVFLSSAYDGTTYSYNAVYAEARDPTSWDHVNADYSSVSFKVGQKLVDGIYTIYRPVMFFDTSSLPDNIEITSVVLSLWARYIYYDDAENIYVVQPGDQTQPPVYSGFVLFDDAEYLGEPISASSWAGGNGTSLYVDVPLSPEGYGIVKVDGTTLVGLRCSNDIGAVAPTGVSYVDIWSGESNHPPMLTVTYDIVALGIPNILKISNTAVFTGYIEPGDQLYVFASNVEYSNTPLYMASDYFAVQLYDDTTLEAQVLVLRWDYAPLAIYLNADEALPVGEDYTLTITGLASKFETPPSYSYNLTNANWAGEAINSDVFRQWIYVVSERMGIEDGIGALGYRDSTDSSLLNGVATAIFTEGIPLINSLFPDRFVRVGEPPPQTGVTTEDTYSDTLYGTWGTYWTDAFDSIGDSVGIPGFWVVSIVFFVMSLATVLLLASQMSSPLIYLAPLPIMVLGCLLGVPIWAAVIVGVMSITYFSFNVLARGLS